MTSVIASTTFANRLFSMAGTIWQRDPLGKEAGRHQLARRRPTEIMSRPPSRPPTTIYSRTITTRRRWPPPRPRQQPRWPQAGRSESTAVAAVLVRATEAGDTITAAAAANGGSNHSNTTTFTTVISENSSSSSHSWRFTALSAPRRLCRRHRVRPTSLHSPRPRRLSRLRPL